MLDRYGFELPAGKRGVPSDKELVERAQAENARLFQWQKMMGDWSTYARGDKHKKLKRRVRDGIPDGVRGHVWQSMSGALEARLARPGAYRALLRRPSPMDSQIRKDLHRTMPMHVQFKQGADGQQQLFNVCHALSLHEPQMGYNQAEAYVAATLLTYMTEEEAFFVMASIVSERGYSRIWADSMAGWQEYGRDKLDALVRARHPKLHRHLEAEGVTVDLYAMPWFLTLFTKDFPFESTLRVLDVFLGEPHPKGSKILFRIVLAVLKATEHELLRMQDVQQLTEHIRTAPMRMAQLQGDRLMESAHSITLKSRKLNLSGSGGGGGAPSSPRGGPGRHPRPPAR